MEQKPTRQLLDVNSVIPNPRNDNVHPQNQIDLLVESIRRFGQPRPILVRAENRMIIGGHGVWLAMRQARELQIDALLWDVDQATADAFLVADNRFTELSHIDPERRRELLSAFSPEEALALGFQAQDLEQLAGGAVPLTVTEVDTGPVADRFWISVRGPLEQQAQVLQRLNFLMGELPEVDVQLGTTASVL